MWQISKFYLSSFLKNQTYFAPVFIILLQLHHLSLQEVFWVFTAGSVVSFLIEIPSGIIADMFGKKKSLIFAKLMIFVSFIIFGFAHTFWVFVLAQMVFELGNAFRSGTESAFVYDFLVQHDCAHAYIEVKAKQKAFARLGEALAAGVGGFIAAFVGFNEVFFVAAAPALLNFFLVLTYQHIDEHKTIVTLGTIYDYMLRPLRHIVTSSLLLIIVGNIVLFASFVAACEKYIQPYMYRMGISVEYFGLMYAVALGIVALCIGLFVSQEHKTADAIFMNILGLFIIASVFVVSLLDVSYLGIILLFLMLIMYSLREPFMANMFQQAIESDTRATSASILEQCKSLGKIIVLPFAGYLTSALTMYVAMGVMAVIAVVLAIIFWVPAYEKK